MTTARRRTAVIAAVAALAAALAPSGGVLAGEEPVVSIDGTICYERTGDAKPYVTLKLSGAVKEDVVVVVHTEDGTAKSPDDYRGFDSVEVRIPAGEVSVEVPLEIMDDEEKEPDEYFMVIIDEAKGATIGDGKAEVVIKDGEPPKEEEPRK